MKMKEAIPSQLGRIPRLWEQLGRWIRPLCFRTPERVLPFKVLTPQTYKTTSFPLRAWPDNPKSFLFFLHLHLDHFHPYTFTTSISNPKNPLDTSTSTSKITCLPSTCENSGASVVLTTALSTPTDAKLHPVSYLIFLILILILIYAYLLLFFYTLTFANVLP